MFHVLLNLLLGVAHASEGAHGATVAVGTYEPFMFLIFAASLLGIAVDHHHRFHYAIGGAVIGVISKYATAVDFSLIPHIGHEAEILGNLFGLLVGFGVLAAYFGVSNIPKIMPRYLPDGWLGGFALLIMVFVLSSFLDNIAAAMIGGLVASIVFRSKEGVATVGVGYLAAITFASNAGGAGSVIGDTTTTMMWLVGYGPDEVLHAYMAAVPAVLFAAYFAAKQQDAIQPIQADPQGEVTIDWVSLGIVAMILAGAIGANLALGIPAIGVWAAILLGWLFRTPDWHEAKEQAIGAVFLLSLVFLASLMPVEVLRQNLPASPAVAFGLGWLSAVFDNIPLTKMALDQGGYDVGHLAFTVGVGGSMTWFGSSAGVALSSKKEFEAAHDVKAWVTQGWFVPVGFCIGYAVLYLTMGWHPHTLGH